MSTCQRIRIPCNIRCDLNRKVFMASERPISCRSSRPHIWSYLYNEVESHHCWSPCTTNATYLLTAAVGSRPVGVEWRGGKLVICSQRCFIDDDNRITRVFDNSETPPCVGLRLSYGFQSWGLESETRDSSQTRISVFETCDLLATCP